MINWKLFITIVPCVFLFISVLDTFLRSTNFLGMREKRKEDAKIDQMFFRFDAILFFAALVLLFCSEFV